MTLTELRYIVAVAQKNHFGKAAQACFVSQPTLSIAIKKLEEELDVRLFERSSKNEIRITEIGQQIINRREIIGIDDTPGGPGRAATTGPPPRTSTLRWSER